MKLAILGAGMQARAVLDGFLRHSGADSIGICDVDGQRAQALAHELGDARVSWSELDVSNTEATMRWLAPFDAALSAVPYRYNLELARAAIQVKTHFADLGGNHDIVDAELRLDREAQQNGVSVIPDVGLAPGLVGLVAVDLLEGLGPPISVQLRVGGLPVDPRPPLNYRLFFSVSGLINEYIEECRVVRDGVIAEVPGMSEPEAIDFPLPFGRLEAFQTSGGVSTLVESLQGRVESLDYKTIRYPGHRDQVSLLNELGFFRQHPVQLKSGSVVPRDLSEALLSDALAEAVEDVILLRVTASGKRNGRPVTGVAEAIEYSDPSRRISAMARCTGYPAAIVTEMQAKGEICGLGAHPSEAVIPAGAFLALLEKRGIAVHKRWWEA